METNGNQKISNKSVRLINVYFNTVETWKNAVKKKTKTTGLEIICQTASTIHLKKIKAL